VISKPMADPALEKLVTSGSMSLLLAARIISLIQESGASQIEAAAAFKIVDALLATMGTVSLSATQ
jgi:hypothetical protein